MRNPSSSGSTLAPWPVVERESYKLEESATRLVAGLVESWQADEHALTDPEPYGAGVRSGCQSVPTLYLEDHRSIQLQSLEQARYFEYRSFGLSSGQDIYLRSVGRVKSFERYYHENLSLGAECVLSVDMSEQDGQSLAIACLNNTDHMDYLASRARQAGGLNICPFLVGDDVWTLANELHRRSSCLITVIGPTPRLASRVNDKLWFYDMASEVLGRQHLPRTLRAYTLGAAVAELQYLAGVTPTVVLKTTSSAGSQGNVVFDSEDLLGLSDKSCRLTVEKALAETGWQNDYPLLTASWEAPVIASPSAQVWIPALTDGEPIIEGLFTQILSGKSAGFVGAEFASLADTQKIQMVHEAGLLSTCLQQLGYFGRVSFDAILVGDDPARPELHWIECNARWGGVSIPMTIANRLAATKDLSASCMRVIQLPQGQCKSEGFVNYCGQLGVDLLDKQSGSGGIVCLTPAGEPDATAAVLIVAGTDAEAIRLTEKTLLSLEPEQT